MSSTSCACGKPGSCCNTHSTVRAGSAVPLPRRKSTNLPSLWSLENPTNPPVTRTEQLQSILGDPQPLAHKCGVDGSGRSTCCKELKGDDERHLISPEVVRDVIIGLSDGLTVPFALTAGLSSLGSSKLVVTAGLAELCAGAISMGLGGYLASQAELDHFHYLRRQTHARVQRSCAGEMEREVHSILGPLGVKEALSRLVAEDLRNVEGGLLDGSMEPQLRLPGAEGVELGIPTLLNDGRSDASRKEKSMWRWLPWKKEKEDEGMDMGLTAFLLKFGEGMEEVPKSRLYISALTIGLSYFIGGLIPLIPYMFNIGADEGLMISAIVTGVILFIFGGFKTYFTGATGGVGGYIYGSVSTAVVGGVAAGAAYGLVRGMSAREDS